MTVDEFNEKYKDYLEKGHYGLAIDHQKVIEYLDKKFEEFIKVPDFKYYQIKIKFGFSRFYADLDVENLNKVEDEIDNILKII